MVGEHDFSAFAHRNPSDTRTPYKRMRRLEVLRDPSAGLSDDGDDSVDAVVTIVAECDRFLQHMMRMLAGTLVQVGLGRLSADDVAPLLWARGRKGLHDAGGVQVYKAPAQGLCLVRCFYAEDCAAGWAVPQSHPLLALKRAALDARTGAENIPSCSEKKNGVPAAAALQRQVISTPRSEDDACQARRRERWRRRIAN